MLHVVAKKDDCTEFNWVYFNTEKAGKSIFLKNQINNCFLHGTKLPNITKPLNLGKYIKASHRTVQRSNKDKSDTERRMPGQSAGPLHFSNSAE